MKMKSNMKKFLALFLSLSLVLAMFGDFAQVKAADSYTPVTLTGTDGNSTSVSGDNWVLYLTTSGYESADWSYKYKGFTYEYNGVTGTTTQVSSADGNRLYCTIPTSVVPAQDGVVFTIKTGTYEPDGEDTTVGLNILNDLTVVAVDGHLVSTKVIEPVAVEPFGGNANSFYFSLKDANGNGISTGLETWDNFLSPSYCDGTRIDTAGWTTTYSGVRADGNPIDYWGANFKNTAVGEFYVGGLSAVQGTTVTVKGHFVSSVQDGWAMKGNFYLPELTFRYDGSTWSYIPSYAEVTLTGTDGWSTCVDNDNSCWKLYMTTSGYSSIDWTKKYAKFTYEINGVPGETSEVSSADGNRLYCTIPISEIPADSGTTFTIKAGDYAPVKDYRGLRITEDLDIVTIDNHLVSTKVIEPVAVEPFGGNANSFYFSLKDANGNGISTGLETWDNFLSPSYCDGTRVAEGDWSTTYSGVRVDGNPIDYWGANFKNTAVGEFYVGGLSAVQGTTVTVKGHFVSSVQDGWAIKGNFYLPELTFRYDGSTWNYVNESEPAYKEYTGTPVFDVSNHPDGFYFTAGETKFPYDAANWRIIAKADEADEESGVFLNGDPTSVYLKKVDSDRWYVCMGDAEIKPEEDDEIMVVGSFVYTDTNGINHRMTFDEATFTFDGTQYKGPEVPPTNYTGTPVLHETGGYVHMVDGVLKGFYFTSEDGAPYDRDWGLTSTAADEEENGVFVNDTKTAISLKKINTNLWYVCIGDAGVKLNADDVLTIKGSFKIGDTADTVVFTEKDFVFNGKRFSDGEFTATEFTITGLAYSDIKYVDNHWNMYFTLSTNIPGDVDATYYPYMTYEINGTEYTTHWFKSSSAHTVNPGTENEEVIYNLYFPISELPQTLDKEYVITIKAGTQQGRVTGTDEAPDEARADGINLTEDYQFVVGGDYEASAPAIDYTMANGGNENGIYLSSGDAFPTIGWDYSLTKSGENSGIYVNGEETEVFIKKYEENKYYVCLSDLSITAVEGTIVMLKGTFTTKELNKVTFKTAKYIYTDKQWKVYTPPVVTEDLTKYGDATRDSETDIVVNSQDLVRIKRYLADANAVEISVVNADLNSSGNVDEHDAALERWLLVNGWGDFEYGSMLQGVPTYTNTTDKMRLAAYVAPEYNADTIASELKAYADAGFTTIIGENRVMYGDSNLDAYMKAALDAKLDVLIQDGTIQNMGDEWLQADFDNNIISDASLIGHTKADFNAKTIEDHFLDLCNRYEDYGNFRGLYLGDEPTIGELDSYTNVINALNSLNEEWDKEWFIAHHPIYTNDTYLWEDVGLSLPEKYLNYAEAFGGLSGEFMYDFYPFRYSTQFGWYDNTLKRRGNYMRDGWFNNLTLAATASKGKVPTGITIQSYAEKLNVEEHYRDVTEADISFQVYSALAYGMKSIQYFTYGEHWDEGVGTTSCITMDSNLYNAVKKINGEIALLDHILLNFNWQGTVGKPVDDADGLMSYVTSYKYNSPRIKDDAAGQDIVTASNDAIIGCLKDLNGYDGFMLVNAKDPIDNKSVEMSVTFKDATAAKVYVAGVEVDSEQYITVNTTDKTTTFNATLAPGQGIFVIPYIAE